MATERREVPVKGILLNVENYRHKPVASQEEAFAELFRDDTKRAEMHALATDIAARGLDPSQLFIVEAEGRRWRVLEGNRRIAVLKALSNPEVIPASIGMTDRALRAYREKFARLGAVFTAPPRVLAVVTDDRELVDHLVMLKHSTQGAHKGAGTVTWDPGGRTRYELHVSAQQGGQPKASNSQSANAIALLDALRQEFVGDDELETLIDRAERTGSSTLGRLLVRAENQLRLGVQIEGQTVRFVVEREALRAAIVRVLTDLGTPDLNSRTTNRAAQVVEYLDTIDGDLPDSRDRLPAPVAPSPAPPAPATRPARRKQPVKVNRVFASLQLSHASPKTREVLKEMRKVKIDDHPYLLAAAVRMLIDLYTADVLDVLGKKPIFSPSERAKKCLYLLEPNHVKRQDRRFPQIHNAVVTDTGDLAIDTMNGFMHRKNFNPTPDTIRVQIEYYEPFLQALDDYVEDQLAAGDEEA